MLKNNRLRLALRHAVLVIFILTAALLQNTAGGILSQYDIGFFLLIPLSVSIAMFEKEFAGMLFGLLAGVLWDISSPVTDGVYALFFTVAAFACGLLSHYVFRNSLKAAAFFTTVVFVLFCTVSLIFNCVLKDPSGAWYYVSHFCVRSFPAVILALPLTYYPVRSIEKNLRQKNAVI